jgi:hypothetical protein
VIKVFVPKKRNAIPIKIRMEPTIWLQPNVSWKIITDINIVITIVPPTTNGITTLAESFSPVSPELPNK